jgi:AcrR family transcriptional regulator
MRLLDAASAEFAAYGIAGARIERIAAAAKANKQMIYAYFGSKDQLFDAVFERHVAESLDEVNFDAADLPAYAGRMFDAFTENPAAARLSTWYRLERPSGVGLDAVRAANQLRLSKLAQAQADGRLSDHFSPIELLAMIQSMATAWDTMNPEFDASMPDRGTRRQAIVDAVARLVDQHPAA